MLLAAEHKYERLREAAEIADHDHVLVFVLDQRLESPWHYDQSIANAKWRGELRHSRQECKAQRHLASSRLRRPLPKNRVTRASNRLFMRARVPGHRP